MKKFEIYLINKGFSIDTIKQYKRYVVYFLDWLKGINLNKLKVKHNDIINFLSYAQNDNKSLNHRNKMLVGLRHFYNSFNRIKVNPAQGLYLQGVERNTFNNFVEFSRLVELYHNYPTSTIREKRNRVILGLLVFQGISNEELHLLQVSLVDLDKGKIHIPQGKRTNSRVLKLDSRQVIPLHDYINNTRNEILTSNSIKSPQLILSTNGNTNLKNTLHHLFAETKKTFPDIKNAKQIRISIIQHWLKSKNVREVQYMCGHRYVSSTEKYLFNNLADLQSDIEKLHPMQ